MSFYSLKIRLNQVSVWSSLVIRYLMPLDMKLCVVTGFPKSGTTWVCQLISDVTGSYFHNKPMVPLLYNSVIHCHRSPFFLGQGMGISRKFIYVVRDPRDVFVSAYHAVLDSRKRVKKVDELPVKLRNFLLDVEGYEDIDTRKIEFVKMALQFFPGSPVDWGEHVRSAMSAPNAAIVRYEDLRNDTEGTLKEILNKIDVSELDEKKLSDVIEKYDFKKQQSLNKKNTAQKGFHRKGRVGGYIDEFPSEAITLIENKFHKEMKDFGYL